MATKRSKAFRAGLKLGLQPPATLAGWVLALDAAYPGEPEALMQLPGEVWAELVTLARAETPVGPPPPALHPAPIVLKTTNAEPVVSVDSGGPDGDAAVEATFRREGDRLVVEGLRTTPARKERLLVIKKGQDPLTAEAPVEASP